MRKYLGVYSFKTLSTMLSEHPRLIKSVYLGAKKFSVIEQPASHWVHQRKGVV